MAEDEEFYFDEYDNDDNVYDEGDDAPAANSWESKLEMQYATAKSQLDSNPSNSIQQFEDAIQKDENKGRWTFKCLKMIARTYQRSRDYPRMRVAFEKMIRWQYASLTKAEKEKCITKFLDRCGQVPQDELLLTLHTAVAYFEEPANKQSMEKLWSQVNLRIVSTHIAERSWEKALDILKRLVEWAKDDDMQRKGTQQTQVYAFLLLIYWETHQSNLVRDAYVTACTAMKNAITPSRTAGIIKEYGGKMLMRLGLWSDATDAFSQAFRSFDEAGDARRLANLRYLVLCSMMSGSQVDPLASNETKTYANDPDVLCMTQLIRASDRNDITTFTKVLADGRMVSILNDDAFLNRFIQPLIQKVRMQVLLAFVKPFSQIRVSRIAEHLKISAEEAQSLCMSAILDGKLIGQVDEATGVLEMASSSSNKNEAQQAAFDSIIQWNELLKQERKALQVSCW